MEDGLHRNFGLVIAYLLPGLILLNGVGDLWPSFSPWLSSNPEAMSSVGGFLHLALASLAAGLVISAIRWAAIDSIHHVTGLSMPQMDFSELQEKLDAFQLAVEHYYRYYQFYSNTLVAVLVVGVVSHWQAGAWKLATYGIVFGLEAVLFFASRDSLGRYYSRTKVLLGAKKR